MSAKYPDVVIHIESDNSVGLYAQIEAGNLDAAFVLEAPYPLPKTCDWLQLREEPLIVLAPRSLGPRAPHDLLRNEPFIRYDRNKWGGRDADEYLKDMAIVPKERIEVDLLQSIAVMVDMNLGVSLVPDWAAPWPENLKIARINLPEVRIGRRVGIVCSRSTVRARLVSLLLEECRQYVGAGAGSKGDPPG
jgi:DNA-binding transcriptional LysR family regulator